MRTEVVGYLTLSRIRADAQPGDLGGARVLSEDVSVADKVTEDILQHKRPLCYYQPQVGVQSAFPVEHAEVDRVQVVTVHLQSGPLRSNPAEFPAEDLVTQPERLFQFGFFVKLLGAIKTFGRQNVL